MRFEDLVGQDHVARTLGNAIKSGRVAHAFLFTGVRGVGKTTSARILAKALNCMRKPGTVPPGEDPGPTVTPCLECPACLEIAAGTDMDVREIDGASYTGVDDVRKLQDSLPYRPTRDRYKIFIVDEVHMLSVNAWNAFLKTLEEPPPHVKFIFATTEAHKIPVTILSRVQRFDFKMISTRAIADRLRYVLGEEKIAADEAAISVMAREAAGSMRDAMSLLDQVIAFSGEELVGDDVARVLGVAGRQALHDLARGLVKGDAAGCLEVVDHVSDQGFAIPNVARDVLSLLRDLVVAKVVSEPGHLLDLADEEQRDVVALAKGADADDLLRLHQGFSRGYDEVVRSASPRAALEMLLVRLARRPPLVPIDDLVSRLGQMERRLGATPARPSAREGESRAARPAAPSGSGRGEPPEGPRPAPYSPPPVTDVRPPEPARAEPARAEPARPDPTRPVQDLALQERVRSHDEAPRGLPSAPPAPPRSEPPAMAPSRPPLASTRPSEPAAPQALPSVAPAKPVPEPTSAEVALLKRLKPFVDRVRETNVELAAYLEQAVPLVVEPGKLQLSFEKGSLFVDKVNARPTLEALGSVASEVLGAPTVVGVTPDHPDAFPHKTLSAERVREREAARREAIARAKAHPRVVDALEVFGARIKEVKLAEG
jgi:DNA polymerase-3 subunit gamma/tau